MLQERARIRRVARLDLPFVLHVVRYHEKSVKSGGKSEQLGGAKETNRDLEPNLARDGFDIFERQLERTRVPVVLEMPQRRTFFVQESG